MTSSKGERDGLNVCCFPFFFLRRCLPIAVSAPTPFRHWFPVAASKLRCVDTFPPTLEVLDRQRACCLPEWIREPRRGRQSFDCERSEPRSRERPRRSFLRESFFLRFSPEREALQQSTNETEREMRAAFLRAGFPCASAGARRSNATSWRLLCQGERERNGREKLLRDPSFCVFFFRSQAALLAS